MKISRTFHPVLTLKLKFVAKYFLKNMSKQAFIANFEFSENVRPKMKV